MSDTVKIVINIDEKALKGYEAIKKYKYPTAIEKAIQNGTPLSEVLDEIKGEFEEHQLSREYCCDHNIDTAIDMGMVRIILGKHINGEGDKG